MDETSLRVMEVVLLVWLLVMVTVMFMKVSYKLRKYHYLNFGFKLFSEYNRRYAELNSELVSLKGRHLKDLGKEDRDILHQYLNLCAEQKYWLGHTSKFDAIKKSWREGVTRCFQDVPALEELWQLEKKNWKSYYLDDEGDELLC